MSSLFGGGGGGGSVQPVNPPKPIQINLQNLQNQMIGADQSAYAAADAYNNQFYPDLTQARDQMIQQAYSALTGPLNPTLQNQFVTQGNIGALSAFGGGNQNAGMMFGGANPRTTWGGISSAARNSAAATVATEEQGYQDYNRQLFEQLNNTFAPRTFGMTPEDAANIFTFNNTQYNNYLQQKFAAATQAYYQNQSLAAGQQAAGTSALSSILGAVISGVAASDERLKENIEATGETTPEGIPHKTFNYKGDPTKQRFLSVTAQDVQKKVPQAVQRGENGSLFVDFSKIHAPYHRIGKEEKEVS